MKIIKKITLVASSLLMVLSLAGCGDKNAEKWAFTKDEAAEFVEFQAEVDQQDGGSNIAVTNTETTFSKPLDKDGYLLFNYDATLKELEDSEEDALSYNIIKNHLVESYGVETSEDLTGFTIKGAQVSGTDFALLVHKDYLANERYAFVTPFDEKGGGEGTLTDEEKAAQKIEEFEEKYAGSKFSWEQGGKFSVQILSNIGGILAGIAFDSPATSVVALFNILQSIGAQFGSSEPTLQDIMNKLNEINSKLNVLLGQIQKNHEQLLAETTYLKAKVDQVILNQQTDAIRNFNNNYINAIDNFNRTYGVEVQQSFKTLVTLGNATVDVAFFKNANNKWDARIYSETYSAPTTDKILTFTIPSFDNAYAHLVSKGGVIESGFMDALYADIDKVVAATSLPEGLDPKLVRLAIANNISEEFNYYYFSSNPVEAQQYANLMIDTCKQYTGNESVPSMVTTYYERMKYMYNFCSEFRKPMNTMLSNHLYRLDVSVAKASQYLRYAGLNDGDLQTYYLAARKVFNNFFDELKKVPDYYSTIVGAPLQANLYSLYINQDWDRTGNHPQLKCKDVIMEKYTGGYNFKREKVDFTKTVRPDSQSHAQIVTRMNLLKNQGIVKADRTYIDYLTDCKVFSEEALATKTRVFNWYNVKQTSIGILTDLTYHGMDDTDRGLQLYCQKSSHKKSNYFSSGSNYGYKTKHKDEYWHGELYRSNLIDINSGAINYNTPVCARAQYNEGHWYWRVDEDWLFYTPIQYYWGLDVVTSK